MRLLVTYIYFHYCYFHVGSHSSRSCLSVAQEGKALTSSQRCKHIIIQSADKWRCTEVLNTAEYETDNENWPVFSWTAGEVKLLKLGFNRPIDPFYCHIFTGTYLVQHDAVQFRGFSTRDTRTLGWDSKDGK